MIEMADFLAKLFVYFHYLCIFANAIQAMLSTNAQVAELVDALVSGTSVSNDVQVRVLSWALVMIATTYRRRWRNW